MVTFDVNLSTGRWPFRPLPHAAFPELLTQLQKHGIRGGLIRSAESVFSSDPETENRQLTEWCRGQSDFIPLLTAHPAWGYWKEWRNVPAAVLYPGFQSFSLLSPQTLGMAQFLADHGTRLLVIVIREEDERAHHPLCRIPAVPAGSIETFAWNLPQTKVIALNAYSWEARAFTAPNLYCDTAFIEGCLALAPIASAAVRQQGRLLFGSHAPFFCVSAGLAKIAELEEQEQAAMQKAAERIIR